MYTYTPTEAKDQSGWNVGVAETYHISQNHATGMVYTLRRGA